jgi:hypothetical protein
VRRAFARVLLTRRGAGPPASVLAVAILQGGCFGHSALGLADGSSDGPSPFDAIRDAAGGGIDEDGGSEGAGSTDAAVASCDGVCSTAFASGPDWASFPGDLQGADGGSLGPASIVCLSASVPADCPPGAVVYTSGGSGWSMDTSAIPGARWIWRADVSPSGPADLQFAVFQKTFVLGASPAGTIQMAADDFVEARVNGITAGATGSVTDVGAASLGHSMLTSVDLGPYLREGLNTITVVAQNGPPSFAGCAGACTYAQNPAGVIFGGTLVYR